MLPGLLSANGLDTAPVVNRAQIPKSIQKNCPQTSDFKKLSSSLRFYSYSHNFQPLPLPLKALIVYMKIFQH